METLAEHLGRWEYFNGNETKFYLVTPQKNGMYTVAWATNHHAGGEIKNLDARQVLRRIRDKQRGGYKLVLPYKTFPNAMPVPSTASLTVRELTNTKTANKTTKKSKSATAKKAGTGFDFMAWLGGKD